MQYTSGMSNQTATETSKLIVNNTGSNIRGFENAIRAIAAGTADAETVEDFSDIFEISSMSDRVIVEWA